MPRQTERHVNPNPSYAHQWASDRGGRDDDEDRARGQQVQRDDDASHRVHDRWRDHERAGQRFADVPYGREDDRAGRAWSQHEDDRAGRTWSRPYVDQARYRQPRRPREDHGSPRLMQDDRERMQRDERPSRRLMQDDRERMMRDRDDDRHERSWMDRARSWFGGDDDDDRDRERGRGGEGERSWMDRARSWFGRDEDDDEDVDRHRSTSDRDRRHFDDDEEARARARAYGAADPWSGRRRMSDEQRYDDRGGRAGQYGPMRAMRRERDDFGRYTGDERFGGWPDERRGAEPQHRRVERDVRGYGGSGSDDRYGRGRDEDRFTSRDRDARFAGGRGYDLGPYDRRSVTRQDRDDRGRFAGIEDRPRDTDEFHYEPPRYRRR